MTRFREIGRNVHFWAKKGIFGTKLAQKRPLHGPNFVISEFSQHIEYDFLKKDHKEIFNTKSYEKFIVAFGSYRPKTVKLALNGQNSAIPWPKIRHIRIFPAYRV